LRRSSTGLSNIARPSRGSASSSYSEVSRTIGFTASSSIANFTRFEDSITALRDNNVSVGEYPSVDLVNIVSRSSSSRKSNINTRASKNAD